MTTAVAPRVLPWYLQGIIQEASAGEGPGLLHVYTAPAPAAGDPPGAATLLGTITLADPLGQISGLTIVFDPSTPDLITDANGIAAWARITDSDGLWVIDGDITDTDGDGAFKIDNPQVYQGGTLSLAGAVLRV